MQPPEQPTEKQYLQCANFEVSEMDTDARSYIQGVISSMGIQEVEAWLFRGIENILPDLLDLRFPSQELNQQFRENVRLDFDEVALVTSPSSMGSRTLNVLPEQFIVDELDLLDYANVLTTRSGIELTDLKTALIAHQTIVQLRNRFGQRIQDDIGVGIFSNSSPRPGLTETEIDEYHRRFHNRLRLRSKTESGKKIIYRLQCAVEKHPDIRVGFEDGTEIWSPARILEEILQTDPLPENAVRPK
jgi:hypothetical protein